MSNIGKQIIAGIIGALFAMPLVALAVPTSWDYASGVLQPLKSQNTATVTVPVIVATSTTASSTFANGISLTGGCFRLASGVCLTTGGSGTVTSIATTFPILGGTITTTGTISWGGISTSTSPTTGHLPYWTSANTIGSVATSSLGVTSPITFSGTLGFQVGGVGGNFACATCLTSATIQSTSTNPFMATYYIATSTATPSVFPNASTTHMSAATSLGIPSSSTQTPLSAGYVAHDTTDNQFKVGTGGSTAIFDQRRALTFSYATTTTWAGTTTLPAIPMPFAMTFNTVQCKTDAGTLNIQVSYGQPATNLAMVPASTTMGTWTWLTNNTPPAATTTTFALGTPASSPTQISCTINGTVTGT